VFEGERERERERERGRERERERERYIYRKREMERGRGGFLVKAVPQIIIVVRVELMDRARISSRGRCNLWHLSCF
jgi:hypothetical protein